MDYSQLVLKKRIVLKLEYSQHRSDLKVGTTLGPEGKTVLAQVPLTGFMIEEDPK